MSLTSACVAENLLNAERDGLQKKGKNGESDSSSLRWLFTKSPFLASGEKLSPLCLPFGL